MTDLLNYIEAKKIAVDYFKNITDYGYYSNHETVLNISSTIIGKYSYLFVSEKLTTHFISPVFGKAHYRDGFYFENIILVSRIDGCIYNYNLFHPIPKYSVYVFDKLEGVVGKRIDLIDKGLSVKRTVNIWYRIYYTFLEKLAKKYRLWERLDH